MTAAQRSQLAYDLAFYEKENAKQMALQLTKERGVDSLSQLDCYRSLNQTVEGFLRGIQGSRGQGEML
jgi:hypothetical protein